MMGAALFLAGVVVGACVGALLMLADTRQLSDAYARATVAAQAALHLVTDTWPLEHGSPRVGNVWAALEGVLRDAERISGERRL